MYRLKRGAFAVAMVLLAFAGAGVPTATFTSDGDYDGIDDALEAQLAAQFLPEIRYNWHESCDWPIPRPILFRLRHPSVNGVIDTNYIAINYVRLYGWDCGVPAWPSEHSGDNEPFLVYLKLVNGTWTFDSISATNHAGTDYTEATASYDPILWVSKSKHANYAQLSSCDGSWGIDYCSGDGPTYSHVLHNVGEPGAPLTNDLVAVEAGWSGELAWGDPQFKDAGNIEDYLYTHRFLQLTRPPAVNGCLYACAVEAKQCIAQNDFEYCQLQKSVCENMCYAQHVWDP